MQSQKTSEASDDEEEGFLMRDEDLHHAMDSDEEPALTLNNRRPGGGGHAPDRFPSATPSPLPPEQGAWGGGGDCLDNLTGVFNTNKKLSRSAFFFFF